MKFFDKIWQTRILMMWLTPILFLATPALAQIPHGDTGPGIDEEAILKSMLHCSPASRLNPDTLNLVFIGDIMLHASQIENTLRPDGTHDFSGYFPDLKKDLEEADLAVANMEFTLAGAPYTGYPAFCAPDSYAEYMADCGIDIFLTANNHILDKGEEGLVRTLQVYRGMERDRGIMMTGSAENADSASRNTPLIVERGKFKIAFINCTYGTNLTFGKKYPGTIYNSDKSLISDAFTRAKEANADLIIAMPHWGIEYKLKHSAEQEEFALWLAAQGADIIIGAHPHVVQDTDTLKVRVGGRTKEVPVIYSLGNAISNMSAPNTQVGLMMKLTLTKSVGTNMLPPEYIMTWCSLPGRLTDSHTTVKIRNYIDRKDAWQQAYEYDKMVSTYYHVLNETKIKNHPFRHVK